jgi:hypothetical protein
MNNDEMTLDNFEQGVKRLEIKIKFDRKLTSHNAMRLEQLVNKKHKIHRSLIKIIRASGEVHEFCARSDFFTLLFCKFSFNKTNNILESKFTKSAKKS